MNARISQAGEQINAAGGYDYIHSSCTNEGKEASTNYVTVIKTSSDITDCSFDAFSAYLDRGDNWRSNLYALAGIRPIYLE